MWLLPTMQSVCEPMALDWRRMVRSVDEFEWLTFNYPYRD